MNEKKINKTKKLMRKIIGSWGVTEGKTDWVTSLDDEELYAVHAINKYNYEVSNVWDNEKREFLLKEFVPVVDQSEPVTIFGSDGVGYKIFSCRDKAFLPLQGKNFNRCFIFRDMIVLANHFAEIVVLYKESEYSEPSHRYIADHVIDLDDEEEFEITEYTSVDKSLLVKSNRDPQCYLYGVEHHELVKVDCS